MRTWQNENIRNEKVIEWDYEKKENENIYKRKWKSEKMRELHNAKHEKHE